MQYLPALIAAVQYLPALIAAVQYLPALIAALQYLPARQRIVLILRDVLGWRAAEVAEFLGMTTTAATATGCGRRTRSRW